MEMKTRRIVHDNVIAALFLLPAMGTFLVFICYPAVQSFFLSLTQWEGIGPKKFVGLANYITIFTQTEQYWATLKNNLLWALCSATIPIWIGLLQANLLVRGRIRFAQVFQMIFFLPQIISSVVAAIIWKWIYDPNLGPLNLILRAVGLEGRGWLGDPHTVLIALFGVYVWQSYGFCTVVFCAALQGIDEQLYDAATIDGCNRWQEFRHITLPSARQSMTTVLLLMIIWSFQVFDLVYTITAGGPGYSSYVISYYVYYEGFMANHVGFATALSITLTVIILVFSTVFMRIREGKEKS